MPHHHLHTDPAAQSFRQLLRKVYRAVLSARAAERNHQALEAATPIRAYTGLNHRYNGGETQSHILLLTEIVDHRRVFACEISKAGFSSRVWKATAIENKPAAVPG